MSNRPAISKTMISGIASKKKGGAPEGSRHKENHMLQVADKEGRGKVVTAKFNTISDHRKLAIWLDKLVTDSAEKRRPQAQMVSLNPALAAVLLERNPTNRKLNESAVERYAYEIAGSRWTFNGEPLIVSDTGELNDGQHRCAAVVKAGKPIDVILIVGVPRESRTTLDQGKMRTAADYLSMEGRANTLVLAAAANYAWQYRTYGMLSSGGKTKATKSEILSFVEENPGLEKATTIFTTKNSRLLGGVAFMTFCRFAIGAVGRSEDVDSFFIALTEGVNLKVGHPVLYIRNRLMTMTGGRDVNGKAELVFKAWNAWRKGDKVDRIWLSGGVLPVLER